MALNDQFYIDAYTGQGGFSTGEYLVAHPREDTDGATSKFERRKALAVYPNYTRKVVDAYLGTLYADPATREGEASAWADLQANADGAGGQIDDLMRRAERLSMLLGTVALLVDRPRGQAATRADEQLLLPYVVIRLPGETEDLSLDDLGNVTRAVFIETGAEGKRYRGWDAQRWWVSEDPEGEKLIVEDGEALTGEHNLGRTPVVLLSSTERLRNTDKRAAAWAGGICEMNRDLYNQWSELRELFRGQTFSILTLPVKDAQQAEALKDVTISTENALTYSPEGGGKPGYVSPPPDPVQQYREHIADTIRMIYELANLEFVGGVQQSGVALAFHFQSANRTLSLMGQELERAEIEIGKLACLWRDDEWDGRSVYPKRFDVEALAQMLQEGMDAITMDLGPTFVALLKKRVARRMLGDGATTAEMEQVDRDIEAQNDEYGDRLAREAQS